MAADAWGPAYLAGAPVPKLDALDAQYPGEGCRASPGLLRQARAAA